MLVGYRASDGTVLEQNNFSNYSGNHGWHDVAFTNPVSVNPGEVLIASYFTPNAKYAFQYEFFTYSPLTVGPITALQAVDGNQNGVYCYVGDSQPCTYPVNHYRDSNYWVSPLWAYHFDGFYRPVENNLLNQAKAGRAIPVKFSLSGDMGLSILKSGYPKVKPTACPNANAPSSIDEEAVTAGDSILSYDADLDQYSYVWKTNKTWAGKCMIFDLGLIDDTDDSFIVQFK